MNVKLFPKTVLMALIGNKYDLKESRVVSTEEE